jgi:ribosomal protein L11 methyltransferase (prmA)
MFHFKEFSIIQEVSSMKVGTDSVILGAWTPAYEPQRILDIGAGTGILSLMMAQRFPTASIHSIEIDPETAEECKQNITLSPWKERISVFQMDIRNFSASNSYDLILSNPPFFSEDTHSPNQKRSLARASHSLPFAQLLNCVNKFLSPQGNFSVVIPYKEETSFLQEATYYSLYPLQKLYLKGTPSSPIKRSFLLLSHQQVTQILIKLLIVEKERHQYTEEYQELTKNFYLKF